MVFPHWTWRSTDTTGEEFEESEDEDLGKLFDPQHKLSYGTGLLSNPLLSLDACLNLSSDGPFIGQTLSPQSLKPVLSLR